ncbi:MAG: DUF2066 domain-containing protein [Gammaproteobacteria bacterium]|nr:DUF2066 domain-containing protein [Gammaproteobacteria bacterium]
MKSCSSNPAGWCRHVVFSVLVLLSIPVSAVEVPSLYTAEVPYNRDARDPRAAAYETALKEILMRVSGSDLARNDAAVKELFPRPESFVMQFRPGANDTLWVSLDGQAIEQVLRNAGETVWGSDRPLTLVWLAVDWGQGEREIVSADDPDRTEGESRSIDRNRLLRTRVLDIAARRGLPLVFPLLDTTDLQMVTFADVWGGFDEMILNASERYDANSILIGRIRPSSGQSGRWTYYFSGTESSLNGTPEAVVGQVADLLASEFAIGGDVPLETVALAVSGIVSIDAYGDVHDVLDDIALIERFTVTEVAGDRVSYNVEVRGGADRLSRALRFSGLVETVPDDPMQTAAALEFFYED